MQNRMLADEYRDDSPVVIAASLLTLVLGLIPKQEWSGMTGKQRCERMEQAGYAWNGKAWRKKEADER